MDIFNLEPILILAREPEDVEAFNYWVQQQDIFPFLENEILDEHIIVYALLPHVVIYSALIPDDDIDNSDIQDLSAWNYFPYSSWSEVGSISVWR